MAYAYASQSNTYVPSHEASGKLIIDYTRNQNDFAVNRYTQMVPVTKPSGLYLDITPTQAGRMISAGIDEYRWPDGQEAPNGTDNHKEFSWLNFFTQRYAFPFTLGDMTIDHATWDILAMYGKMAAQEAMTALSYLAATALSTSGNYSNTATATSAGGGKFDVGTAIAPYFKKGLFAGAQAIHKATFGKVKPTDLHIVMSPAAASLISTSQEIHSYLKESPDAFRVLEGQILKNSMWGLPPSIYGFPIEIEDAVYSADKKSSSSTTPAYVLGSTVVALVARPGALEGQYGGPNFSFLQRFTLEELTVETMKDPPNRLTRGRVTQNYQLVAVAPAAGYLFTSATG